MEPGMSQQRNLFDIAYQVLMTCDPDEKVSLTHFYARQWNDGLLPKITTDEPVAVPVPGRPEKPLLVHPSQVPRRKLHSEEGRAALVHAITHIEFNAINLAWDAVYRFRDMPEKFYTDWMKVADEEAYHFALLRERLRDLGYEYGDFEAHNGLWEMACKTDYDVMVRMALVPRVLEARGLDVTPGMMEKLKKVGDQRTLALLHIILRDEIGHVEIGTRWFRYICEKRKLDSIDTFRQLLEEHMKGHIKGPFYDEARIMAGFDERELENLRMQAKVR
jgi:uncharacterized ferritin-like protein (DUF455 family)